MGEPEHRDRDEQLVDEHDQADGDERRNRVVVDPDAEPAPNTAHPR